MTSAGWLDLGQLLGELYADDEAQQRYRLYLNQITDGPPAEPRADGSGKWSWRRRDLVHDEVWERGHCGG